MPGPGLSHRPRQAPRPLVTTADTYVGTADTYAGPELSHRPKHSALEVQYKLLKIRTSAIWLRAPPPRVPTADIHVGTADTYAEGGAHGRGYGFHGRGFGAYGLGFGAHGRVQLLQRKQRGRNQLQRH